MNMYVCATGNSPSSALDSSGPPVSLPLPPGSDLLSQGRQPRPHLGAEPVLQAAASLWDTYSLLPCAEESRSA